MRLIDASELTPDMFIETNSFPERPEIGVPITHVGVSVMQLDKAPTIATKQIKYFDEEEKVWKIGSVIVNE